jgi:hypothetical protein
MLLVGSLQVPWSRDCAGLNLLVVLLAVTVWMQRHRQLDRGFWLRVAAAFPAALAANAAAWPDHPAVICGADRLSWREFVARADKLAGTLADHGVKPGDQVYFVHSFAYEAEDAEDVIATTDYGGDVTAVVRRGDLTVMQFHPEKSQDNGLRLLGNWVRRYA